MSRLNSLPDLNINEIAVIEDCPYDKIGSTRLQEMGLIAGHFIRLIKKAPFKGPVEIKLQGSYLILRRDLAKKVKIKRLN